MKRVKLPKWVKIVDIMNPGFARSMANAYRIEAETRHLLKAEKE